jgi:hypothetical protein
MGDEERGAREFSLCLTEIFTQDSEIFATIYTAFVFICGICQ